MIGGACTRPLFSSLLLQETLLEYLGIKPASSVGGDSYVEEPPYVVVPNKDFNGAYQTPYKDSKELEEVCEGDVPFVECRVEIQDGGEPGAKPPPEHNDYNYKVKEGKKPTSSLFICGNRDGYEENHKPGYFL